MYSKKDSDEYCLQIGKRFKQLRMAKGLTREKCAIECEMSRSYLYKLEAEQANLSINEIFKLANGLECKISDLLPKNS